MTAIELLDALQKFIEEKTKDIVLQEKGKEGLERAAKVFKMRLPNKDAETKLIPYILLQFLTGKDDDAAASSESECKIRIVVVTYSEDGSEGAMDVLNLLTRIRIVLLENGLIDERFLVKKPLEYIVYPDDTDPYYLGEMVVTFEMPTIERRWQNG